jgi:hypothetical protein
VAGIWTYDGNSFSLVHQVNRKYVTQIADWRGHLFAATSSGWKNDSGTSTLLMSADGSSWTKVCDFPELAAWSIEEFNDRLYIGTWQYQSGGRLYEASPR